MLFLLFSLMMAETPSDVTLQKEFPLPEDGEEYLSFPYSMSFAPDGRLFVVDRATRRVLTWSPDGSFDKGFGKKGQGPGELSDPVKIHATDDALYIWENRQLISVFDHAGGFVETISIPGLAARNFAVLNDDLFLLGIRSKFENNEPPAMSFELRNRKGQQIEKLRSFPNEAVLTPPKGSNAFHIKAFAPEIDIQQGSDGRWFFGFSQNRTLYEIDQKGKIVGEKTFEIPTGQPTEAEQDIVMGMSFNLPNGQTIALADLPNMNVHFDHDKAYYTNFLIKGDKIAFVLTPIGTTDSVGNGYASATYTVNDFGTGKLLTRGRYAFPKDSYVLYRNGRAVAFVLDEEEEYRIYEISLRGF